MHIIVKVIKSCCSLVETLNWIRIIKSNRIVAAEAKKTDSNQLLFVDHYTVVSVTTGRFFLF